LQLEPDGWHIGSVAADCVWEGPVIRAHKRPVDPTYWDAKRNLKNDHEGVKKYYEEMHDTFALAGIHALKTKEQAIEAAWEYGVSCYGEVALYGRVAQFELGYRAEACMIKRLFLFHNTHSYGNKEDLTYFQGSTRRHEKVARMKSDLEKRYGCEVTGP
jgi:hypothetical protein